MNAAAISTSSVWSAGVALLPAAVAGIAAVAAPRRRSVAAGWSIARAATLAMVALAAAATAVRVGAGSQATALVRLDTVTVLMLALIVLVGWVVVRFSSTYLAGDPHERRYIGRLLTTLAAVALVVVANDLVLLVLAWSGASVALHGLLTFFGDRPVAVAVAHKKFLLARCADACMLGAVVALATTFDTLRIDEIGARAMAAGSLPAGARVGVALIAVAALLKCAQLPFHGWLIQVMEAPTTVSALLHAGMVNLGGFVLLRFAPLVDRAVETRTLLVVAGTATAVVASLVMTTRVSVKVLLAWSTCAQMGFMLVQCGLGLWQMALLHLLAHSVYKAHAFLAAGGTVRQAQRQRLAASSTAPGAGTVAVGVVTAAVATVAVATGWQLLWFTDRLPRATWLMLGIVALALVPLTFPTVAAAQARGAHRAWAAWGRNLTGRVAAAVLAVPLVYLALHELAGRMVGRGADPPAALLIVAGLGFTGLFAVRTACLVAPAAPALGRLRRWVYAGLFLDDAFTRIAFAAVPPPAPSPRPAALPLPPVLVVGVDRHALIGSRSPAPSPTHQPLEMEPA